MMRKYITGCIMLLALSACSDFLTENSQNQAYIESYTDLDELLLGAGYMDFYDTDGYYPYIHVMGDEAKENATKSYYGMDYTNSRDKLFGFYTWQKQVNLSYDKYSTYDVDFKDWEKMYKHIKNVNTILSYIDSQKAPTESDKKEVKRIKGEASFLRAAYYFALVNLYGKPYQASSSTDLGVPLNLSEVVEDKQFKRNTVAEVYEQVLADLEIAEALLDQTGHKSVYRADIAAVNLLQSRVFLYMGDYAKAKDYAAKVIERKGKLTDLNTFKVAGDVFISPKSVEVIFSMGPNVYVDIVSGCIKGFMVDEAIYHAMDEKDMRRSVFFHFYEEESADTTFRCAKYINYNTELTVVPQFSDIYTFRSAEAYLNLAEAAACSGDFVTAVNALNTLRRNRIQTNAYREITETGNTLIARIREERKYELCFEGHRWFDLRRYAVDKTYPQIHTLTSSYSLIGAADFNYPIQGGSRYTMDMDDLANTLPIPEKVANFDNMPNNPRSERPGVSIQ